MSQISAIMFDFTDGRSTASAWEMLQQLGYDPVMHGGNRLHIHVNGADLISALEIAQSYGGRLVEQAAMETESITNSAYALDAITIPAHVVNEDWLDSAVERSLGAANESRLNSAAEAEQTNDDSDEISLDGNTYNHFSGDVHI